MNSLSLDTSTYPYSFLHEHAPLGHHSNPANLILGPMITAQNTMPFPSVFLSQSVHPWSGVSPYDSNNHLMLGKIYHGKL